MSTNEAVKLETIKLYQGVERGDGVSTLTKLIADGADVNWKNLKKARHEQVSAMNNRIFGTNGFCHQHLRKQT